MNTITTTFLKAAHAASTMSVNGQPVTSRQLCQDSLRLFLTDDPLTSFVDVEDQAIMIVDGRARVVDRVNTYRVITFANTTPFNVTNPLTEEDVRLSNFQIPHSYA